MASELELLAAWQRGDRQAGDALLSRYFWSVFRFFRSKVDGPVEDLTQRVFLACMEARHRVRPDLGFRAYLFGIARHELYGFFKSMRRDLEIEALETMSIVDLAPAPSAVIADRQEQRLLLQALRTIPTDFQIAVELYYWEGMAVAEIAGVLGVAPGTVKSRLGRARRMLRDAIETMAPGPAVLESTLRALDLMHAPESAR
jgi:RNA polymerase sigma-70 factor (ECF subfamily)